MAVVSGVVEFVVQHYRVSFSMFLALSSISGAQSSTSLLYASIYVRKQYKLVAITIDILCQIENRYKYKCALCLCCAYYMEQTLQMGSRFTAIDRFAFVVVSTS